MIIFEFCDWAEARVQAGEAGDAQRVLRGYGYHIWRLSDFACGRGRPLRDVLVSGYEMLVAVRG